MPYAGFELALNLKPGFVEWSCAVVENHYFTMLKNVTKKKQVTDFATVSIIDCLFLLLLVFLFRKHKIRSLHAVGHSLILS